MKTLSTSLLLSALLIFPRFAPAADKWDAQWKKVDEAVQQGLPKTAIERLQPILDGATAEKNYPVAIKAIGRKIALEGNIQGNKPEEKIIRLEAEIAKSPAEMQPMLEVILADWYWQYFQHNRWRFMQRTATAGPAGQGFHHLGPAAAVCRDRQAFSKGPGRRGATQEDPRRRPSANCWKRAPCPTATGPRSTTSWPTRPWSSTTPANRRRPRRRTPSSFRPTAPFSGRPRSLSPGSPSPLPLSQRERGDRTRFDHAQGHPAVPAIAPLPSKRRG